MTKQMNLMVRLNVPMGISGLKIAEILQKLIEIGVNDARETVKSGEGDQQEARAASHMAVESITELNPYALDGKCHNAEPGTYGHECGKPATWLGVKPNGFASGFCDHCKEHGWEAKPCKEWTHLPQPAEFMAIQEVWEAAGGNPGIRATREEVIEALRMLDQICDETDVPASNNSGYRRLAEQPHEEVAKTVSKWRGELSTYLEGDCAGEPPRLAIAGARAFFGELLGLRTQDQVCDQAECDGQN